MTKNTLTTNLFIAIALGLALGAVYAEGPNAVSPTAVNGQAQGSVPYPPRMAVDRQAKPLKIAFVSYANPQQVVKDIGPIVKYLEPFVGVPIEGFITLDYGSSLEAMRSKQADLATVDPLAFMMAYERIGAKPLLLEIYSNGLSTYHSCIWVRRDGGVQDLEDLKGKTIAFADQIDMSGHLLPRDVFVQEGLVSARHREGEFFKQVYFAGGDEQAIRALLNNFVDAAGVSQYAYLLLRPEERSEVFTIAKSIESPAHLMMARKDLPNEICGRIKQALLALDATRSEDKAILDKLYGIQGYTEAKLADFAQVAQVAARYGFIKKPQLFAAPSPAPSAKTNADGSAVSSASTSAQPVNAVCPLSGDPVDASIQTVAYSGKVYGFCCSQCAAQYKSDPEGALQRLRADD